MSAVPAETNRDAAATAALDWAVAVGLGDAAARARLEQMGITRLAALMYPDVPAAWLALATRWTLWTFIADDELDGYTDEATAKARVTALRARDDGALGAALRQITDAFAAAAPAHAASFVTDADDFLDACVWEARNRQDERVPSPADYRRMRPRTGAMWPFLRIALAAAGVTPEVARAPELAALLDTAAWLPCLANDLVSVDKELRAGDTHNAVIVEQRHHGRTIDEARGIASTAYARDRRAYADALAATSLLSSEQKRALIAIVDGPAGWLSEARRYLTAPSASRSAR